MDGDKYSILPIIAMDTDAIEENKEKLLSYGFTDNIVKPMDIRRVAALLKDCLPESLIKEKTNDIALYIEGSRYKDGLEKLKPYMDVEYAIEKIGGSIDVFNKLVRLFYEQNAAVSEELYRKSSTDVRGFKTKIHGLKASCANIGAMALAHEATKMEGAINIGNREYVNDNIEEFIEKLVDVLFAIEEYIGFIDSISGMSDEEYALRNSNKNDETTETKLLQEGEIFQYLENIKTFATSEDYAEVSSIMNELHAYNLEGEDKEFIEALNEVVSNKEQEGIIELVNTYYALKL
ncbi:MAG: hypothetical protein IJX12_00215 [Lachnospiraceae bacterium]|nr:hypothetical protein [Lachnospiraceae bacterium]